MTMSMDRGARRSQTGETEPERLYGCGPAARWLPRAMAAAVLATSMLSAFRIDATSQAMAPTVRNVVVFAGALLALGVVRKGSEVRHVFGLTGDALTVVVGSRSLRLGLAEIQRLDYAAPFAGSTSWLPASVILDRDGRAWRVPALIDGGDRLFVELLRRAARHDLDSWADEYHIVPRMGRYRWRIRMGYAVTAAILVVGLGYYLH